MMRLHKIKLENFISHVRTEVDFEEIVRTYATNFLLISGDTGSGKSAILDGLIAGLYGPGGKKTYIGGREPLSSYVPNGQWQVEIEFSIAEKRYKVVRKGSTATWYVESDGQMFRINEPPALPIKDGDLARKVMVIPQGEYLKLLAATKSERQELLLDLINLQWLDPFINGMKNRLKAHEMAAKQNASILGNSLSTAFQNVLNQSQYPVLKEASSWIEPLLEQLKQLDSQQMVEELLSLIYQQKVLDRLEQLQKAMENGKKEIENRFKQKEEQKSELQKQLTRLEAISSKELSQKLTNFKNLENKRGEINLLEQKLDKLRFLKQHFQEDLEALDRLTNEIAEIRMEMDQIQKGVTELKQKKALLEELDAIVSQHGENVVEGMKDLISAVKDLTAALESGRSYRQKWQEEENHRSAVQSLLQKAQNLQKLADLPGKIEPYLDTLSRYQEELAHLEKEEKEKKKVHNELNKKKKRVANLLNEIELRRKALEEQSEARNKEILMLKAEKAKVEKERNTIEANYRKVIIAELVSQLKENEPCPICGSKHHPQPATVEALSHHDLQQIIKKRNQIREKLEKLDQQICESEEAQAELDEEIDSLTKEKEHIQQELNELNVQLKTTESELASLRKQMETKKSEIQNSETKLEEILRQTLVYEKSYVEEFGIQRYAALVLKALEYAWEKLLQSLKEMDLSSESTDFSGHAIGNIINTLQERKNRIDQAKQKYEEWCNEIYTPKIEEVESKRKNLQGGLEDFEQALKDKQGESAQELRKLIGQLKRETQELRKLIERLKRETMDINLFQEGESVQGLENFNQSLAEQASKVDTQVEKIKEKISEIEKAISMEEGKLKTRQKDLHRKTEEQKNLYETIETHRVEHQIEESIEAIREYLKQVDQQTQWQEAITAWKTQRKTTFTGLLNEVERLKQQWETILPEVSLPQIQIQSLPEEMLQNTHTDMENTINGIEQWLSQVEQTYTERIGQMQEKLGELTKECETLQKEMESVNTFIGVFRGRIGEIDMQVKKVEGARNELQKFQRLAELTGVEEKRGKEALPGLKTWLYQFILKKMLGNASPYLREFTDGRLDFAPSEDDGMEKIRMVDHTYSKVRNVNDLSGGEKFMAALSLALGLTDLLIQFEKGATRPNFMFIDEGFGTLDAERLEKVVARLKAYAEKADILLGIVSHRREMHELAPVRIHVTHDRTRRGSKVEIIPQ